jgi:hypothetical protein
VGHLGSCFVCSGGGCALLYVVVRCFFRCSLVVFGGAWLCDVYCHEVHWQRHWRVLCIIGGPLILVRFEFVGGAWFVLFFNLWCLFVVCGECV